MADVNYGADSEGFERSLAQMKQLQGQKQELDAKDKQLRQGEEATAGAIIDNTAAMTRAIEITENLSGQIARLTTSLGAEAEMLRASTLAWQQNATARAEASVAAAGGARGGAVAPVVPVVPVGGAGEAAAARQAAAGGAVAAPVVAAATRAEAVTSAELLSPEAFGGISAMQVMAMRRAAQQQQQIVMPAGQRSGQRSLMPGPQVQGENQARVAQQAAAAEREQATQLAQLQQREAMAATEAKELAAAQVRANLAFNASVGAYSQSSQALSRHGALTTEFLQAFARGQVTLREFESQMLSTIGKFGGWAVAGTLVYGAFNAIKDIGRGAAQTQEGIQELSTAIPSVSSGRSRNQAEQTFRDVSVQMNVPISEVTASMTTMARSFHNVTDAGEGARAALYAVKLGGMSQAEATQNIVSLAQGLGVKGGAPLVGVMDQLTSLQARTGAPMRETLPGLALASPLVGVAGVQEPQLAGFLGVATRGGFGGEQAAQVLMRSAAMYAYRGPSQQELGRLGIPTQRGQFGDTLTAVMARAPDMSAGERSAVASALGGPRGAAVWTRALNEPQQYQAMVQQAQHPQVTAQEELDRVLGGIGDQFHHLGIIMQSVGSELESAGILSAVEGVVHGLGLLGTGLERAIHPLTSVISVFSELPGPMKDLIGVMLLVGGGRMIAQRAGLFGFVKDPQGAMYSETEMRKDPRGVLRGITGQQQTSLQPLLRTGVEQADVAVMNTASARRLALERVDTTAPGTAARQEANDAAAAAERRYLTAVDEAAIAADRLAENERIIATLTNTGIGLQERMNYALAKMLVTTEGAATTTVGRQLGATGAAARGTSGETLPSGAVLLGGAAAAGGVAGALKSADRSTRLTTAGLVAEAEEPSSTASVLSEPVVPVAAGMTPAEMAKLEQQAVAPTGMIPLLRDRQLRPAASAAAQNPFMWMIGAQALGMLPGGVGGFFQNQVGGMAMGAMLSSMGGETMAGGLSSIARRIPGIGGRLAGSAFMAEGLPRVMSNPLFGAGLMGIAGGMGTPGAGGWLESIGGGAALGGSIGAAFGGVAAPIGAAVGAGVGALTHLLGDQSKSASGADAATVLASRNFGQLSQQLTSGTAGKGVITSWTEQLKGLLTTAYGGDESSQDAQAAQAIVSKTITSTAKLIDVFPIVTKMGQSGLQQLEQIAASAISSSAMTTDPGNIGAAMQNAITAVNTSIGNQLDYVTAAARHPSDIIGGVHKASQSYTQAYSSIITQPLADQREQVAGLRTLMASSTPQAFQQSLASTRAQIQQVAATAPTGSGKERPSHADVASAWDDRGVQARIQAQVPDTTKLFRQYNDLIEAAKGGTKGQAALKDALTAAEAVQQQIEGAATGTARELGKSLVTKLDSAYKGIQGLVTNIEEVAVAAAGPDKLKQAHAQLNATNSQLSYLQKSWGALTKAQQADPQVQAMFTAQRDALLPTRQQQIEAIGADTVSRMQARSGLAAAQVGPYDPVGQARTALEGQDKVVKYMTANSNQFDPTAVLQAQSQLATDWWAYQQAVYQHASELASAEEQLAVASHPDDPVAQGMAQATQGRTMLSLAKTEAQRVSATAMIKSGNVAAAEGARQVTDLGYQATEARQQGNSVAQAYTAIAMANYELASALGPTEVGQARVAVAQAYYQLHQALLNRITAIGQLRAAETADPVKQDMITYQAALQALHTAVAGNYGADVIRQQQTSVHQALMKRNQDTEQQGAALIEFQGGMMQISVQQMIERYKKLLSTPLLSPDTYRSIRQRMRELELGQFTPIGGSQATFDIAPGNIKMPTVFDVMHAIGRRAAAPHMVHAVHAPVSSEINVYVSKSEDVPKVADAIERATGGQLHARLRAAGMRG